MSARSTTPLAVFTYNRARHARACLAALARCHGLAECRVYVFCDGPKEGERHEPIEQSRRVVRAWAAGRNARVVERETNLGLARSIVSGVNELTEEHGRAIVVEDDLLVNPRFLVYMLQGLSAYECEERVCQVSGYMFPLACAHGSDAFFIPLVTTWGWATWRRAWRIFDWNPADAPACLKEPETRRAFDLDDSYPYSAMLERRLEGGNDSWGILWWWAVFRAGGVSLYPARSLVRNAGFDGSGTHTPPIRARQRLERRESQADAGTDRFRFPETVEIDAQAFEQVKRFLKHQHRPAPPFSPRRLWWRLAGRLRKT